MAQSPGRSTADDRDVLDRLVDLVYPELRRIAHQRLRMERANHTLNTTALVHEAYLRLADQKTPLGDRGRFLAVASIAMRRILVDHARRRASAKRGGPNVHVPLDTSQLPVEPLLDAVLAVDDAMQRLARVDERLCLVVECRFFAGFTDEETATALGVTTRTVERDWAKARALLYDDLEA
jgi:RNA polymerase sigma factor (TIGR02999 family)